MDYRYDIQEHAKEDFHYDVWNLVLPHENRLYGHKKPRRHGAAEFSLGQPNGKPTDQMMDYFEERAKGGVDMIIPGICRVNDMGGASTFIQLSMSHDYHIEPMRIFAKRIHQYGTKLCIQLHHPGRQGMASAINSLPVVIPFADRFPGIMNLIYKCTPALLKMEEKGICAQACPISALDMKKEGKSGKYRNVFPEPNNRTCTGCGICAKACPMEAITMVEVEEK